MRCSWWSVGLVAVSLLASRAAHGQAGESTTMVLPDTPSEDTVAVTRTVGGVISGNLETGSPNCETPPAMMITIEITEAKIGR